MSSNYLTNYYQKELPFRVIYGSAVNVSQDVTAEFVEFFYAPNSKSIIVPKNVQFNLYFGDVAPNFAKQLSIEFASGYKILLPEITTELFYYTIQSFPSERLVELQQCFRFSKSVELFEFLNANNFLREKLLSGVPFCCARLGHSEIMIIDKRDKTAAATHVGVSPPTEYEMNVFSVEYRNALLYSDCCLVFERPYFEYYIDNVCPQIKRISANATCEGLHNILFPDALKYPQFWFHSLASKKVLLVTPLKESIPQQYGKQLFDESVTYPLFKTLEILESPMTQSLPDDNYESASWSVHYSRLKTELSTKDFDVALLGCGGYALPLAAECKKLGKQAIVLGGILQLFFGVLGERWVPRITELQCQIKWENWVRPTENERPPVWKKIEQGCYW